MVKKQASDVVVLQQRYRTQQIDQNGYSEQISS
jgi:hypothetical protein